MAYVLQDATLTQEQFREATSANQTVRVGIPQQHTLAAKIYTIGEVARILGISPDLVRLWIKAGNYRHR
jgi:hypothetical protein